MWDHLSEIPALYIQLPILGECFLIQNKVKRHIGDALEDF